MTPARFFPLLLISISLLTASCGSPPSGSSPAPQRAQATAATTAPAETTMEETTSAPERTVEKTAREKPAKEGAKPKREPAGKVVEVKIQALEYASGPVTVAPGTTVRWVNEDRALHTVTSEGSGGPLDSGDLERGDSFEHTFREPGRYDYYCVVHPFMKGGVTVG